MFFCKGKRIRWFVISSWNVVAFGESLLTFEYSSVLNTLCHSFLSASVTLHHQSGPTSLQYTVICVEFEVWHSTSWRCSPKINFTQRVAKKSLHCSQLIYIWTAVTVVSLFPESLLTFVCHSITTLKTFTLFLCNYTTKDVTKCSVSANS